MMKEEVLHSPWFRSRPRLAMVPGPADGIGRTGAPNFRCVQDSLERMTLGGLGGWINSRREGCTRRTCREVGIPDRGRSRDATGNAAPVHLNGHDMLIDG